jgi:serine/threonine protein kinase
MILQKYEIQTKIGNGKFGSVFLGENRISKKQVAIKIEESAGCLRNEARILEFLTRNKIQDVVPNIFWYGVQEKYTILVMTYISGISLSKYYFSQENQVKNSIIWWIDAIRTLEKIHNIGVIHRDIKPEHFLYRNGKWVLIDFGFATFSLSTINRTRENINTREYIIGTPNYISIPVHSGFSPTTTDDLISLGYIFLEIQAGKRLSWASVPSVPSVPSAQTEYSECHILHPHHQYKKKRKEIWEKENPENVIVRYLQTISSISEDVSNIGNESIYSTLINILSKEYK